ncbi:MAG: hypothetical protein IJW82_04475, partial [Clostridia bacterium]|nr:hypothetical protein [Clostridia bacterium]
MSRYKYVYGDNILIKRNNRQGIIIEVLSEEEMQYIDLHDFKKKTIKTEDVEYLPPKECDMELLKEFIFFK